MRCACQWICAAGLLFICLTPRPGQAQQDNWSERSGLNQSRVLHGLCAAHGRLYAFGGQTVGGGEGIASVEEYDPDTDQWRFRSDMPSARLGMMVASVNNRCYLFGGAQGPGSEALGRVEEYNPSTDSWRRMADMPTARVAGAAAVAGGRIYVAGGWVFGSTTSQALGSMESYDPVSDSWAVHAAMPSERALTAASVLDGQVYVLGGGSLAFGTLDSARVERFDPETDSWARLADLPTPRGALASAAAGDTVLAIGGGFVSGHVATVESYDPVADTWSAGVPLPTARWGLASASLGKWVFVTGGSNETGVGHNSLAANEAYRTSGFAINQGLNDAWFNPLTNGQGFFIIVFPDIPLVFLAWFTYDTERPPEDVEAILGDPGHRWITAQGGFEGDTATLDLVITRGGVFNAGEPAPENEIDGTMVVTFEDCTAGTVAYDIPSLGLMGVVPIQRIANDNVAMCRELAVD